MHFGWGDGEVGMNGNVLAIRPNVRLVVALKLSFMFGGHAMHTGQLYMNIETVMANRQLEWGCHFYMIYMLAE